MTALNQAFIKAYTKDEPHASVPRPHFVTKPNVEVKRQAAPQAADRIVAEERTLTASNEMQVANVRPVVPSPQLGPALFAEPASTEPPAHTLALEGESAPAVTKIPLSQASTVRPAFEVDQVIWPDVCKSLAARIVDQLDIVVNEFARPRGGGSMTVGIAGIGQGVGCTTITLTLAKHLCQQQSAAPDAELLVIDADIEQSVIANRLGLAPQACWHDTVSGRAPLEDTLIESIDDRMVFIPLARNKLTASHFNSRKITADLEMLAAQHRTTLVDLGALDQSENSGLFGVIGGQLDVLLLVRDARTTSDTQVKEVIDLAVQAGIEVSGIIENWSAETSRTTKAA